MRSVDLPSVSLLTLLAAFSGPFACSSSASPANPAPGEPRDAGITTDAEPSTDASTSGPAIPDSPAGRRLAFVLEAMNGAKLDDAILRASFTKDFLADVPLSTLRSTFADMATTKPWTLRAFDGPVSATALVAVVSDAKGTHLRVRIVTSTAEDDKMSTLFLEPAGDLDPELADWSKLDSALAGVSPTAALLAADLDASCAEIHAKGANDRVALGSVFKLYVLAELAKQVEAGTRSFSDMLAIEDRYKSLPSGELQNEPAGTELSLKTYAEKMISISDNTATDHLLFLVGRENVEATVASSGHHAPAENRPFVSTRELFTLKLMLSSAEQDAYVAASEADKRSLLTTYASRDPRTSKKAWNDPLRIDTLEWFATPSDLCKVAGVLKAAGDKPATKPVYDVLAKNPGIEPGADAFAYVGYKGGSEPGVLVLTWILRRKDNGWRFLTVAFNDTTKAIDETRALYVASAARAMMAR